MGRQGILQLRQQRLQGLPLVRRERSKRILRDPRVHRNHPLPHRGPLAGQERREVQAGQNSGED